VLEISIGEKNMKKIIICLSTLIMIPEFCYANISIKNLRCHAEINNLNINTSINKSNEKFILDYSVSDSLGNITKQYFISRAYLDTKDKNITVKGIAVEYSDCDSREEIELIVYFEKSNDNGLILFTQDNAKSNTFFTRCIF
jgi:hypothetical protein